MPRAARSYPSCRIECVPLREELELLGDLKGAREAGGQFMPESAEVIFDLIVGHQQFDAKEILDDLPTAIHVQPGEDAARGYRTAAGRHCHLRDHCDSRK